MGTAAKKKRPMRSVRSGVKKLELVKANLTILKKYVALLVILFIASCTPFRYVDIERPYTYRHQPNVHTVPTWIPGYGVVLQQQRWHRPVLRKPSYRPTPLRKPLQRPNTNWRVPRKN